MLLWFYTLGCYCTPKENYFLCPKMAIGYAELKTSFSKATKDYSQLFDQLLRSVGGYANMIIILCTLVGFDDWIEMFSDEEGIG